jgi:hypothetical protein
LWIVGGYEFYPSTQYERELEDDEHALEEDSSDDDCEKFENDVPWDW